MTPNQPNRAGFENWNDHLEAVIKYLKVSKHMVIQLYREFEPRARDLFFNVKSKQEAYERKVSLQERMRQRARERLESDCKAAGLDAWPGSKTAPPPPPMPASDTATEGRANKKQMPESQQGVAGPALSSGGQHDSDLDAEAGSR